MKTKRLGFYREDVSKDLHEAYNALRTIDLSLAERLRTYAHGVAEGYEWATHEEIRDRNGATR